MTADSGVHKLFYPLVATALEDDFDRGLVDGSIPWPPAGDANRQRAWNLLRKLDESAGFFRWDVGLAPARTPGVLLPIFFHRTPEGGVTVRAWRCAPMSVQPGAEWAIRRLLFVERLRDVLVGTPGAMPWSSTVFLALLAPPPSHASGKDEPGEALAQAFRKSFRTMLFTLDGTRSALLVSLARAARDCRAAPDAGLLPPDLEDRLLDAIREKLIFRTVSHRADTQQVVCTIVAQLEPFEPARSLMARLSLLALDL